MREKNRHILKWKILSSSFIFVKVKWIRTGVKGARTHFSSLQNVVSSAPCFSPLTEMLDCIKFNQLPFINVEMWLICKDLLFLYAILHTGTVIFSIMWFDVTTGKTLKPVEEFSKALKGDWYPALISVGDKRLNSSPVSPCVHHHFSQTNEVLHWFLILHLVRHCYFLAFVCTCQEIAEVNLTVTDI